MARAEPKPETRTCQNPDCAKTFVVRRRDQKHCDAVCATMHRNRSRAYGGKRGPPSYAEAVAAVGEDLQDAELISIAETRGYVIHKPRPQEHETDMLDAAKIKGERVRICVVSDTHLGSKYQQITYLRQVYRYAQKEAKVDAFLHCGDLVDGSPRMHRDAPYTMHRHGYDSQRDYAVENFPESKAGTWIIYGNHDYSFVNGDGGYIVRDVCDRRPDMHYLGGPQAYTVFGKVRILLHHPFDGGAYGLSYKPQRWVEQVSPEGKPHLWFGGNYHKCLHMPAYRNVDVFLCPSFQSQTPFMRGKSLHSAIGAWIVEFGHGSKGLTGSLKTERILFHEPLENDF